MAGSKSFSINARIKTTFEGAEKGIEKIKSSLAGMNTSVPGVTDAMSGEFAKMGVELEGLKQRAQQGVLTGAFGDAGATKAFLDDLRKQDKLYTDLTQKTVFANKIDADAVKTIEAQTAAINSKQAALEANELALDAIRQKTRGIAEEELKVGNKLKIDPATLRDPQKIQSEIDKRKTPGGKPKDKKAEDEIKDLENLIKKRQEFEKASAGTLASEQLLKDQINQQNIELDRQKQERREGTLQAVKQLKVGDDLTQEEKEKLIALVKQGQEYEDMEKSLRNLNYVQQAKEIRDTTNANKQFTKSMDQKKRGLFQNITAATVYYAALRAVRRIITNITKTVTDLDKSFTEIAMVTNMTRKES
jgi:hypothetical protein